LCKVYNYGFRDEPEVLRDWRHCQNSINIETAFFDNIVKNLNLLNIKKINSSRIHTVLHPTQYKLTFSGNSFSIYTNTNSPIIKTKERGLVKYLALCDKIWKLSEL
jgi:hypothetical protein